MTVADRLGVADDVVNVLHDSVDIDRPLDSLMVISFRVDKIVCDKVGDTHILELALDHSYGLFARLSNDV